MRECAGHHTPGPGGGVNLWVWGSIGWTRNEAWRRGGSLPSRHSTAGFQGVSEAPRGGVLPDVCSG